MRLRCLDTKDSIHPVPARQFAALIAHLHPGKSIRQLTDAAGLAENKIAYYLKPSTTITRIPPASTVNELADALGCNPVEVVQAFAADAELPWGDIVLSEEDRDLLRLLHKLPAAERRKIRLVLMTLITANEVEAEAEIKAEPAVEVEPAVEAERTSPPATPRQRAAQRTDTPGRPNVTRGSRKR